MTGVLAGSVVVRVSRLLWLRVLPIVTSVTVFL